MLEPFLFPAAVRARAYARRHLLRSLVFWGSGAILALTVLGAWFASLALAGEGEPALLIGGTLALALSSWKGALAALDLWEKPLLFEGRVAGKAASPFWNRLTFLEDKYYLRLERGPAMRPLALGTGREVQGGWFLAARGYHEILSPGDGVRGALHRRTRLVARLVKP
ncbi:MAG: hypothetical protein AABZ64_04615 [Nitrospinota bacterium]